MLYEVITRLGIFDVEPHLILGTAAGMVFPLLLVPIGLAVQVV